MPPVSVLVLRLVRVAAGVTEPVNVSVNRVPPPAGAL
jgi:hypothetical protein